MPTRRLTSDELQVRLLPVFKRDQIVKAILFGLMACEEASRRSDFDLILIQRTSRRSWDRSAPAALRAKPRFARSGPRCGSLHA